MADHGSTSRRTLPTPGLTGCAAGAAMLVILALLAADAGASTIQPVAGEPITASANTESRPLRAAGPIVEPGSAAPHAGDEPGWFRTLGSLALVLGLIVAAWFALRGVVRRGGWPAWAIGPARAPAGVVEILGRYPVFRGTTLLLLRVDRRILVLSQSPSGLRTLADIAEPDDVASILIKTRDEEGASSAERFNELLREMARDPATIDDSTAEAAGDDGQLADSLRRRLTRTLEARA